MANSSDKNETQAPKVLSEKETNFINGLKGHTYHVAAPKPLKQDKNKKTKGETAKNDIPLSFDLDHENSVYLTKEGQFYHSKLTMNKGEEKWSETLKFSAPIEILSLIQQGENWRIRYFFDREIRQDSIDTTMSLIKNKLSLDQGSSKLFAQFLYKFKTEKIDNGEYEIAYEPVAVVDGIVRVNKFTDQPVKDIMQVLIDIHLISTYPDSFLTSLCYNLMAPFSYEIRREGQKFPFRLSAGKTHGGKTQEQVLLTLKGFDQDLQKRKETMNTIKTTFTFGQQVEVSRLPFLADDVNNEWFNFHSEELKGATDSVKFMARGRKDQTQNVWDMVGMPVFTMNAEPSLPLALKDRIIMSYFTSEHSSRQNKREFERLKDMLKPGFMFNLIKETLEGVSISDILRDVHKSVKTDEEINQKIIEYAHDLLNKLAEKHGLKFPDVPKLDENKGYDLLELFCTYVATRYNSMDRDGTTYQKFSRYVADKEGEKNEMLITSGGYNDFVREFRLNGLKHMTDFINELKNPEIRIEYRWVRGTATTTRCIVIPMELVFDKTKKREDGSDDLLD